MPSIKSLGFDLLQSLNSPCLYFDPVHPGQPHLHRETGRASLYQNILTLVKFGRMKDNFDSLRNLVYVVDPYGIKELGMLINL